MVLCSSTILFVALGLRLRPVSASVREECLLTAVAWVVPEGMARWGIVVVLGGVGFLVKSVDRVSPFRSTSFEFNLGLVSSGPLSGGLRGETWGLL
ncbi:hypothetical protein Bca52824_027822 [Brassica carinata]|uniref:Secreted protein n=1 Tax=Brassica carinata TaxID=52824 RepID=A0A8X7VBA2_BRACI|nr:hypothetical protein Bca52824_027822 [Brassica carinata]